MKRQAGFLFGLLPALSVHAEMHPRSTTLVPVTDPTMVVDDRGTKLEVFLTRRASITPDSTGKPTVHAVAVSTEAVPFSRSQPGLVFNHSYQQYGYITGEIAFRMKGGVAPGNDFTATLYPKLSRVGTLDFFVVRASKPREFLAVLKRLHARDDIEWVVPTVTYVPGTATGALH